MGDFLNVVITIISYATGAWVAFKIYDVKMRGKNAKNDLLLYALLLAFGAGGGSLLNYLIKAYLNGQ